MLVHDQHCSNCFLINCEDDGCQMVQCSYCKCRLHECKLENHQNEICERVNVRCINFGNGCPKILRRDKIGIHLEKCIASAVVCSSQWSRKTHTPTSKQDLKKKGKQLKLDETHSSDLDIQMAIRDQNEIVSGYNTSRLFRVLQRDLLHSDTPLFPLRELRSVARYNNTNQGSTCSDENSSEDEIREKKEKRKKSRLVFSNCYICQVDPSSQHLHTLGNGTELEKIKKKRISPKQADLFHEEQNLKINLQIEKLPDTTVSEIRKDCTVYTFRCSETVRRSEFADHHISQHVLTNEYLDSLILRCPNWTRGCMFTDCRLKTSNGKFRLVPDSSAVTNILTNAGHVIQSASPDKLTLETLPLWVYETLASYLPSTSLSNLSKTSRNLRANIFVGCQENCYVEPKWVKGETRGAWEQSGFLLKISLVEPPQHLECCVPVELSKHISTCEYSQPIVYKEQRVPVFPEALVNCLGYEFEDSLLQRIFDVDQF